MRPVVVGILLLGLLLVVPAAGLTQSATPATPGATPASPGTDPDALATRVAELEGTVAALTLAQIEADLRADELAQGLVPLLEELPERVVVIGFLQSQIDDLRSRVDGLEAALASATPADTARHALVGTWAVREDASGGIPGLVSFTPDGTVVVISPGGGSGIGAWATTGPQSAIAVWVFLNSAGAGEGRTTTALQARITVDGEGQSITIEYQIMSITPRGSVSEHGSGTITGVRVPIETPTPVPETGQP
jgi:hypothetical protein